MRKALILLWMLFPVTVLAYHYNFGAKQMARERAYDQLREIRKLQRQEKPDWLAIVDAYEVLRTELPPNEDP